MVENVAAKMSANLVVFTPESFANFSAKMEKEKMHEKHQEQQARHNRNISQDRVRKNEIKQSDALHHDALLSELLCIGFQ